jgi:hypothetical protein
LSKELLARKIKSCSLLIFKVVISGFAMRTLGFPPNLAIFASISPKALDTFEKKLTTMTQRKFTESLPGRILKGTLKAKGLFLGSKSILFPVILVGKFL